MKGKIVKFVDLGPMHDLLIRACPPNPKTGVKSIPQLAERLGLTRYAIYKWIEAGKIPPHHVLRIVALSNGRLAKREEFDEFVYVL